MKRFTPSISTGSMADVAFLLLVFFLLVTEIAQDEGLQHKLPRPDPGISAPIPEQHVLRVTLGSQGEMLVEDAPASLEDLRVWVNAFYLNGGVFEEEPPRTDLPVRWAAETPVEVESMEIFGAFRHLPGDALIELRSRPDTPYDWYIEVVNAITAEVHELRDDLVEPLAGTGWLSLSVKDAYEQRVRRAAQQVFPMRMADNWPVTTE